MKNLFMACIALAGVMVMTVALVNYLDRPMAFKSWSTKQCTFIREIDGTEYDCSAYATIDHVTVDDHGFPQNLSFEIVYVE